MTKTVMAPTRTPAARALHVARRVLVAALLLGVVIALYLFVLTRGAIL